MLEQYGQSVSDELQERYGVDVPWDQIIEIVLQILEDCDFYQNEHDFVESAQSPTWLQRIAMNVRVRNTLGIRGFRKVRQISDVMFDKAAKRSDSELSAAFAEGQAVLGNVSEGRAVLGNVYYGEEVE